MQLIHFSMIIVGFIGLSVGAAYGMLGVIAVLRWKAQKRRIVSAQPRAVTLLKPLCGAEPGLYRNLRSFCRQDYPAYQIVFGLRDSADPAHAVALRLKEEFPSLSIDIVIDPQLHGTNCKISNLINMLPYARFDVLVMADSDAYVDRDYLQSVTEPLTDPKVGLVTCLYHGVPTPEIWSRLGAMYVNEWYRPSVLVAWLFGHQAYVSGQTIGLRRDTLQAIGGFDALANQLADDFRLGELIRNLGLRVVLSPYVVDGEHYEPSLESVARHELRWMRTLRMLRPMSFRWLFLSFSLPLATLGIAFASLDPAHSTLAKSLFATAVVTRLLLHFLQRRGARPVWSDLWLIPARDLLLCCVWCQSFTSSRVSWRGREFDVDPQGVMRRLN